ncbi:MAG: tRNA 2-thiouridine(34) synthase MnmA [Clostridiales bacterium]|jgi:tRNA-specific 2-thiouridylase|nr:tRNA 2-thiouridine(34) synthase MnmA [Clostridiales bacterium]
MNGKKAFIAMSGGVDSSVAAYIMKQTGFDCCGVTLKLFDENEAENSIRDAKAVCDKLGIPHKVYDFTAAFKEKIIEKFIASYESCKTPNPCVDCNREIKFGLLMDAAFEMGMDYIATGHYARVCYNETQNRYELKKAGDTSKDQSYVLYSLTQEKLAHIKLPLGNMTKPEVREIAQNLGFVTAEKKDSQDICFIKGCDYFEFIENYTGKKYAQGNFTDKSGNVLGKHSGLVRYTIGQRKGLGLALPHPMYVCEKNAENNTVVLCDNNELFSAELTAGNFSFVSGSAEKYPVRVLAKIRYAHREQPAVITEISADTVNITFDEPQRAITKGQALVLYNGDTVLGGGTIL